MKIIPPDPPPDEPARPAPKPAPRATTTRFLRLTPAQDVAPVAPHPGTRALPSLTSRTDPKPARAPIAIKPPVFAPTSGSALEPAAVSPPVDPKSAPAPSPAPAAKVPPPATEPAPPEPPRASGPLPSPADQPDDRPMRLTTKRLPNIFAAAPSARWSGPAAASAAPLRIIPPSVLAGSAEALIAPPEVPAPALEAVAPEPTPELIPLASPVTPTEARRSGVLPVPRLKLRRREVETAELPPPAEPVPEAIVPPEPAPSPEPEKLAEPAPPSEPALPTTTPPKVRPPSEFIPERRPVLKEPAPGEGLAHAYPARGEDFFRSPAESPLAPPFPAEEKAAALAPSGEEPAAEILAAAETPASRPAFVAKHRLTPPPVGLAEMAKTERGSLGKGFWLLLLLLVLVLLGLLYWFGLTPRIAAGKELDHEQKLSTERIVAYGVAHLATPHVELPLPGTIEASQQASLYARTTGYVKKWYADIGDQVKAGQLLAVLDTPEVEQQLEQAIAADAQAQADLNIAQSAAQRWDTMAKARAVSQEDTDAKDAAYNEAKAKFTSAEAEVARLTDLENYKEIRAPFQGKITYRNIDVGSLVTAGTGTPNSELFRLAQTDPLRVYVDVPESDAPAIKAGVQASIQVNSYPGRVFHGEVVRDAGALSDSSRTLRTEIRVDNPDGALLPGAFAEVRLQLLDSQPAVLIPASALVVNASGTSVALLQDHYGHDIVHYTPVRVGRDFGTEVEILENVHQGDRLVTNPPADLTDGTEVTSKPEERTNAPSVVPAAPAPPTRA
jgi:RND family efflux transporter MFP subunit